MAYCTVKPQTWWTTCRFWCFVGAVARKAPQNWRQSHWVSMRPCFTSFLAQGFGAKGAQNAEHLEPTFTSQLDIAYYHLIPFFFVDYFAFLYSNLFCCPIFSRSFPDDALLIHSSRIHSFSVCFHHLDTDSILLYI